MKLFSFLNSKSIFDWLYSPNRGFFFYTNGHNPNPRGYPQFIHDEVWDLKATPDGGCIIVAGTGDEYTYSESCEGSIDKSDTWHVYLIKFNSEGDIEWDKTYYDSVGADRAGEAIDLTSDGGAIIAVDNSLFGFLKIVPFL